MSCVKYMFAVLTVSAFFVASVVSASAATISDGSFENDHVATDDTTAGDLSTGPSWNMGNGNGYWNPTDTHFAGATDDPDGTMGSPTDGEQVAYLLIQGAGADRSSFQSIGTIDALTIYTVSFAYGHRADSAAQPFLDPNPNFSVNLESGATILGGASFGTPLGVTGETALSSPAVGTWNSASFSFDSSDFAGLVGDDLTLRFSAGGEGMILFANFVLTETVIPEPASVALLGLGGLATIGRRRRRA